MENRLKGLIILPAFFIRCFVLMILECGVLASSAQHFISGFVKDRETGEPLIGASVFIPATTVGVATSPTGFYVIKLPFQDTLTLIATFIGYQPVIKKIKPGKDKQADFFLKRGVELAEIKVRAPLVSEKKFGANIIEIPAGELRNLPSLGGETDLVRIYQLLPGIQGGTEGKAGLFVRGGGNDQNLVLLDGFPLYYINHLGGFTSLFDPEAVKNFRLYKGGFPARYGNRLSSVLDVSLKEGDKYKARHTLSVGLISGGASSQGPVIKGKGSYFVSLRRMWLDILTRPLTYLAFDGFSTDAKNAKFKRLA